MASPTRQSLNFATYYIPHTKMVGSSPAISVSQCLAVLFLPRQRIGNHVITTIRRLACATGGDDDILLAGFG